MSLPRKSRGSPRCTSLTGFVALAVLILIVTFFNTPVPNKNIVVQGRHRGVREGRGTSGKARETSTTHEVATIDSPDEDRADGWECLFYKTANFTGSAIKSWKKTLVTDWQIRPGWEFQGPPELDYQATNFSMSCFTTFSVSPGSYSFNVFAQADFMELEVDKKSLLRQAGVSFQVDRSFRMKLAAGKHTARFRIAERGNSKRCWALVSHVRIFEEKEPDNALSLAEQAACLTSFDCSRPHTTCSHRITQGFGLSLHSEIEWGFCVPLMQPFMSDCLMYGIGIRNLIDNELLHGHMGCEVHAFDCTQDFTFLKSKAKRENLTYKEYKSEGVNHVHLGPNVTYHDWCIGEEGFQLQLDGTYTKKKDLVFKTLSSIVETLGHTERMLTVLKMDCEGCEWEGLEDLFTNRPKTFDSIQILQVEWHYLARDDGEVHLDRMARVAARMRDFTAYSAHTNSALHSGRFKEHHIEPKLVESGAHNGTCCYERAYVRKH